MKYKKITAGALFLTAIAICAQANATPGKLNSSGCHNSKKAGYHCHRTQPVKKPATPKK